jgi:hypothetical protein
MSWGLINNFASSFLKSSLDILAGSPFLPPDGVLLIIRDVHHSLLKTLAEDCGENNNH